MKTEYAFTILAALFVVIAVVFLWRDNFSAAFVIGALGAVAWFLSYRFRLRATFPVTDDVEEESTEDASEYKHQNESDHPVER